MVVLVHTISIYIVRNSNIGSHWKKLVATVVHIHTLQYMYIVSSRMNLH